MSLDHWSRRGRMRAFTYGIPLLSSRRSAGQDRHWAMDDNQPKLRKAIPSCAGRLQARNMGWRGSGYAPLVITAGRSAATARMVFRYRHKVFLYGHTRAVSRLAQMQEILLTAEHYARGQSSPPWSRSTPLRGDRAGQRVVASWTEHRRSRRRVSPLLTTPPALAKGVMSRCDSQIVNSNSPPGICQESTISDSDRAGAPTGKQRLAPNPALTCAVI